MFDKARYLTDDRDLPEEDQRALVIFPGGASTHCPGLGVAIADAYRAMQAAQRGERKSVPSRMDLVDELAAWRTRFPELKFQFGELFEI